MKKRFLVLFAALFASMQIVSAQELLNEVNPATNLSSVPKFEFTINGETKVVSAGDALYMEPDVKHGCKCLEPGLLIDCFSPMRETFLQK